MPVLSMFYGIIIRMQSEHGGKHHVPHIHVICGDDESVFTLDVNNWKAKFLRVKRNLLKHGLKFTRKIYRQTGNC